MRKRLRKKLRRGEFSELGCQVSVLFKNGLSDDAINRFVDEFIAQAVEAHGLCFGGGGDSKQWCGFLTRPSRASVEEIHRQQLTSWLTARPEVLEFAIGPLVDAWNGYDQNIPGK